MKCVPTANPRLQFDRDKKSANSKDRFHLLIDCPDEESQRRLYEQLTARGLKCRVLVL